MITSEVPVVVLRGTPLERGRIYGESQRQRIHECTRVWLDLLGTARGRSPADYIGEFLLETGFYQVIARQAPDLLDEVRGLAAGADLPLEIILAQQLHDEEWIYARNARLLGPQASRERCSSAGAWGEDLSCPIMGQNVDIGRYADGFQTILRIEEDDRTALAFTTAGTIGMCGLNSASVGLCCNTLIQLDFSFSGLPVAFIVRRVLSQPSFAKARDFLLNVSHASGQNYLLGGPDSVVSLECSANDVAEYRSSGSLTRVVHTNHPLASTDQSFIRTAMPTLSEEELSCSPTSFGRLRSLERRLLTPETRFDREALFAALAAKDEPSAPICRDGSSGMPGDPDAHIGFTAASLVYELGAPPVMHFAAGPPSESEYVRLECR